MTRAEPARAKVRPQGGMSGPAAYGPQEQGTAADGTGRPSYLDRLSPEALARHEQQMTALREAAAEAFERNPGGPMPPAMAARIRRLLAPPAQQDPQPATAA